MDNLPPSGFQFVGEDYGPVDFPGSLPGEMQAGMAFAGGGPVFPQNQRGGSYGMPTFHMNYPQQASMPAMSSLPSGTFRTRFTDYPPDQGPHLTMSLSTAAPGMLSDRLPSFSTIVSSSGTSSTDIAKSAQALYSSISGQQHAFQPSGSRGIQNHFDSSSYPEQVSGKNYSKSPSHGSTSPGMGNTGYANNIPHSALMQHAAHNGSSQHMPSHSPRSYKDDGPSQQQYLGGAMHLDRHGVYNHGGMVQSSGESMTIPKFKHKYLAHNQHMPRRHHGPCKFFIIGKTERPSVFNKGTQTNEEQMGELKIKIPKAEIYRSESEADFSDDDDARVHRRRIAQNQVPRGSPRITFPYDPLPAQGGEYRDFNKSPKVKTIISPSFLDAAGKATMTTCVANKATIVTVGIVSRPSGLGGAFPTDSSQNKRIMSTGNAHTYRAHPNKHNSRRDLDIKVDHQFDEEQLLEERKAKARELEQDRMEVSVRIDDTQYVQVGNAKRWQCTECDKSYTTKHNLVMHVLDHSGIKPHLCLKCGKYFKQLSHLNTHMLTHDQIKPHTCNMCGKGFTQISHLKRHTAVSEKNGYCANLRSRHPSGHSPSSSQHSGPGIHTSPGVVVKRYSDQNQSFDSEYDMEDIKDGDKNGLGGKLLCHYCDRKFRYPSQLKDHMQSHNGNRPYMCIECGMDFMKEHHLKAHQFTHTGLKPYSCDICGRSFNQRANLQRHKLIHETTRTFKCNICSKSFTQPQTLKAHQVVHADRKPFECTICGKEFGRYHNLQGHMHMHTNTKPYVCFCGSTFTLKGNLNRHKKVKHGLNETTDVMEEDAVNFLSSLSERARDDHNMDGENGSLSPGSEGEDGKSNRKGRKSIPRKISQGDVDGEESAVVPSTDLSAPVAPQMALSQQAAVGTEIPGNSSQVGASKPFVIQNPDTDDEVDEDEDEEESGKAPSASTEKLATPAPSVMNFQPLNVNTGKENEAMAKPSSKRRDEVSQAEKRPRRQSQRRSLKVNAIGVEAHDSGGENELSTDVNDNTDTDWVPGSRRRLRGKPDVLERGKM
ncbi:Krueppel 1 [Biomphalaria pfeifferi]|uniref:Krueppel 1 n=1 Tax=Biomphalaria pfeifferi TaxID=112525 RepID=A0AAD8BUM2_BIOPF|nr:Krueppel 1 [Biomphalaria pfeifferi]